MTDGASDARQLHQRVDATLQAFLRTRLPVLQDVSPELGPVSEAALAFLAEGGKRLRPAFCYWGWRGAGGADSEQIVAAACCLELLHACALVHDDVMDRSDTRRGRPAVHRQFAAVHRGAGWVGDADDFGAAAAILLGDLCLIWASQLLDGCGLPPSALERGRPVYERIRVQLMAGQYLDLFEQGRGAGSTLERALRVARYKSAVYTIEGPLVLGGALAGASPGLLEAYARFGLPLGEAFQLRDDLLGVFGDPAETGKPAGDDLREGKRTALVAATLSAATPAQAGVVRRHLGDRQLDADGVAALRRVITDTGAVGAVERLIAERTAAALEALDSAPDLRPAAHAVLADLAAAATRRVL